MILPFNTQKERETVAKWLDLKPLALLKENSPFGYLEVLKVGLPENAVYSFMTHSGLTKEQVLKLLHISEKTLKEKKTVRYSDSGTAD